MVYFSELMSGRNPTWCRRTKKLPRLVSMNHRVASLPGPRGCTQVYKPRSWTAMLTSSIVVFSLPLLCGQQATAMLSTLPAEWTSNWDKDCRKLEELQNGLDIYHLNLTTSWNFTIKGNPRLTISWSILPGQTPVDYYYVRIYMPDSVFEDCAEVKRVIARTNRSKDQGRRATFAVDSSRCPSVQSCVDSHLLRVEMSNEHVQPSSFGLEVYPQKFKAIAFQQKLFYPTCRKDLSCPVVRVPMWPPGYEGSQGKKDVLCKCYTAQVNRQLVNISLNDDERLVISWQAAQDKDSPVNFYEITVKNSSSVAVASMTNWSGRTFIVRDRLHPGNYTLELSSTPDSPVRLKPMDPIRISFVIMLREENATYNKSDRAYVFYVTPTDDHLPTTSQPSTTTSATEHDLEDGGSPATSLATNVTLTTAPASNVTHIVPHDSESNMAVIMLATAGGVLLAICVIVLAKFCLMEKLRLKRLTSVKIVHPAEETSISSLKDFQSPEPQTTAEIIRKPTVYISYSRWQNSQNDTVRDFAAALHHCGISVLLDQFHEVTLANGTVNWISDSISQSDYIIIILSKEYPLCLSADVRQELFSSQLPEYQRAVIEVELVQGKMLYGQSGFIIPVYLGPRPMPFEVPTVLRNKSVYTMSPPFSTQCLDKLLRRVYRAEEYTL